LKMGGATSVIYLIGSWEKTKTLKWLMTIRLRQQDYNLRLRSDLWQLD
jgi:hypothetical protein